MVRRKLKHSLAVSTLVANMLMIAITLSLGAILVAWAGASFGSFSGGSQLYYVQRAQALQERFVIENVFFNSTAKTVMIFVRNVGSVDITAVALYVNGAPNLRMNPGSWLCTSLPTRIGVQAVCEFNLNWGDYTSGSVVSVLVASSRGNQAVYTARAS